MKPEPRPKWHGAPRVCTPQAGHASRHAGSAGGAPRAAQHLDWRHRQARLLLARLSAASVLPQRLAAHGADGGISLRTAMGSCRARLLPGDSGTMSAILRTAAPAQPTEAADHHSTPTPSLDAQEPYVKCASILSILESKEPDDATRARLQSQASLPLSRTPRLLFEPAGARTNGLAIGAP